jgi:hypothetical protein
MQEKGSNRIGFYFLRGGPRTNLAPTSGQQGELTSHSLVRGADKNSGGPQHRPYYLLFLVIMSLTKVPEYLRFGRSTLNQTNISTLQFLQFPMYTLLYTIFFINVQEMKGILLY